MNKKKVLLVLLILIVVVIVFSVVCRNCKFNKKTKFTVSQITDINEAYDVKECVYKYYEYCKNYIDTNETLLFNLIDKDYIKYYDLNKYNFKRNIKVIESDRLKIKKVYKIFNSDNSNLYIVKADELYKSERESKEFNLMLKVDFKKNIFSVFPNDYIIDNNYNNLSLGDRGSIVINDNIEKNDDNTFDISQKSIKNNVNDIFDDYKSLCTFYYKYSYNVLDEDLKKERFPDFETYDKYLTENFKDIVVMKLLSYEENQKDGYVEYKCKDNKGKSYVFKVYSYITYTVTIE